MKRIIVAIIILMVNCALAERKLEKIIPCSNYTSYITKDAVNDTQAFKDINNKKYIPTEANGSVQEQKKQVYF